MKAIRQYEFGGPDTLRYEDVPDPEPGAEQVRIEVHACGVHLVDATLRAGVQRGPSLPTLPAVTTSPLADAALAHVAMGSRRTVGKTVLIP